jgi:hypothetical protein
MDREDVRLTGVWDFAEPDPAAGDADPGDLRKAFYHLYFGNQQQYGIAHNH